MPKPSPDRPRRADLPFVKVSRLRATGVINPSMDEAEIEVGGLKRPVKLWHMHFKWNGGSWSFFLCPHCSRKCQILRLNDGRMVCRSCDGAGRPASSKRRASGIERLRAKLAKPDLKKRRNTLEISLRRALIAQRREKLSGWPPKK